MMGFGKELKGKRKDWRLQFWRGMEHGFYPDKRAQNLWKLIRWLPIVSVMFMAEEGRRTCLHGFSLKHL